MGIKKEINWDEIEFYVKAGCKQINICKKFFLDEVTLRARVKEKYGMDWSAFSVALISEGEMLYEAKAYEKASKGHWDSIKWGLQVRCGQRLPDAVQSLPANQQQIDESHEIMRLKHELAELRANADKS